MKPARSALLCLSRANRCRRGSPRREFHTDGAEEEQEGPGGSWRQNRWSRFQRRIAEAYQRAELLKASSFRLSAASLMSALRASFFRLPRFARRLRIGRRRARVFAQEAPRSKPLRCTKNAAPANDRARRPQWRRAAFSDGEPELRFSGLRSGDTDANARARRSPQRGAAGLPKRMPAFGGQSPAAQSGRQ
jgi:hypothetical protein